ncbi:hypothetical protein EK904_011687 [Melospiza melodia maxima]|nr:hypothetical protein EK904_011687 [Melospiza melodia maxima]
MKLLRFFKIERNVLQLSIGYVDQTEHRGKMDKCSLDTQHLTVAYILLFQRHLKICFQALDNPIFSNMLPNGPLQFTRLVLCGELKHSLKHFLNQQKVCFKHILSTRPPEEDVIVNQNGVLIRSECEEGGSSREKIILQSRALLFSNSDEISW